MKKFMAILLSAVLCATAAYSAFAVDADDEAAPVAAVENEKKAVSDVVADLKENDKAVEIAENIVDAVKSGASSKDVKALLGELEKYVNGAGFELEDLKKSGTARDVLDQFLTDAGIDVEALNDAISESVIADAALSIYNKTPQEKPTEPEEPEEPETPVIPDMGDLG